MDDNIVSIHLMLLFIIVAFCEVSEINAVSIHLMLLFIIYVVLENMVNVGVSIHLMLLFIFQCLNCIFIITSFQYISCYSLSN